MQTVLQLLKARVKKLEDALNQLERNLPRCDCGFLLMADETTGHHFQCYACGAWWDVSKAFLFDPKDNPRSRGPQGTLPRGTIPQNRRRSQTH